MALAVSIRGCFVVWTQNDVLVELILINNIRRNLCQLRSFFRQCMVKALFNIEPSTSCGKCEKILLNKNKISDNEEK